MVILVVLTDKKTPNPRLPAPEELKCISCWNCVSCAPKSICSWKHWGVSGGERFPALLAPFCLWMFMDVYGHLQAPKELDCNQMVDDNRSFGHSSVGRIFLLGALSQWHRVRHGRRSHPCAGVCSVGQQRR